MGTAIFLLGRDQFLSSHDVPANKNTSKHFEVKYEAVVCPTEVDASPPSAPIIRWEMERFKIGFRKKREKEN